MNKTFEITIQGQVQGVGFRPFVFGLARKFDLQGSVCNNAVGVLIYVNTSKKAALVFLRELLRSAPAISRIRSHTLKEIDFEAFDDFNIVPSQKKTPINLPLTPDFAICQSCKDDIRNLENRRFQYPFTTCVQCGPRYAITKKFPFERSHTAMTDFTMCGICQEEYVNPHDRRFHSQTNSCSDCGIQLTLTNSEGETVNGRYPDLIKKTADAIQQGEIVALKNTNGYLLCCDARKDSAVIRLRERKKRPSKPFALVYPHISSIREHFHVDDREEEALLSAVAPIVLLFPKIPIDTLATQTIAPGLKQLGVMLPSSALLQLLMDELGFPIVATSGNIHGSPIISDRADAEKLLTNVADSFLHHNLHIEFPQDDSVIKFSKEYQIILRRSRGLAPNFMGSTLTSDKPVLAMGGHLKSTFALLPNSHTYVSPYFGNLDNYNVLERYAKTITRYTELFETIPEIILIDSHPLYQSGFLGRELAEQWKIPVQEVQHHKAHFASVLGEHDLFGSPEKILGVIWDGTGYGDDQAIWGGEFFTYKDCQIERLSHFEYFDWIAGDKMAQEPRLSLLSLLSKEKKDSIKSKFSETEWKVYLKMLQNNTLKTSSVGRLFDAVASLSDIKDRTTYEGEAAMLLENCASDYMGNDPKDFLENEVYQNIPTKKIIASIFGEFTNGTSREKIAASFIHTLAKSIVRVAKQNHIKTILCSGGVFQNSQLVDSLGYMAVENQVVIKFNRILSGNDENIAFGQLSYYQSIKD